MKCTRCEHELPTTALFCGKCGTPVTKTVTPTPVEPPPADANLGLTTAHSVQAQQAAARIQAAKWEEQRLALMQIQSTINSISQAQTSQKQDLDARLQRLNQDSDERQIELNQLIMGMRNLESRLNQLSQTVQSPVSVPALEFPESFKLDPQDKSALLQVLNSLQGRIDGLSRDVQDQIRLGGHVVSTTSSTGGEAPGLDVNVLLRALRESWDSSWQEHLLLLNERLSTDVPASLGDSSSGGVDEAALAAHLSATVDASVRVALSQRSMGAGSAPDLSGITQEFAQIRQDLHRMASTLERVVNHQAEVSERQVQMLQQELISRGEAMQAQIQVQLQTQLESVQQALLDQFDARWQQVLEQNALKSSAPTTAPDRMQKLEPRLESRLEALFQHAPGASKDKSSTPGHDDESGQDAVPMWLWVLLGGVSTVTVVLGIIAAVKLLGHH